MLKSYLNLPLVRLGGALLLASMLWGCGGPEQRAASYFEKAQELFAQENYVKAQLELRNALQIKDDLVDAWHLLAKVQEKQSEWRAAFGSYQKALTLQPDYIPSLIGRGRILVAARDFDKAAVDADRALQLAPGDSDALALKAGVSLGQGNRDEAESLAEKALAADGGNEIARVFLALLFAEDERLNKANVLIDDGLAAAPDSVRLIEVKTRLAGLAGDRDGVLRGLRRLVELQPDQSARVYQLAGALAAVDRAAEAEQLLRDHLARKPESEEAALQLANLLVATRDASAAEIALREMVAVDNRGFLQFRLAEFFVQQGKINDAEAVYQQLITVDPLGADASRARLALADLALRDNRPDDAGRLAGEVLAQNPQDGDALLVRATLSLRERRIDDAIADLRIVIVDRPESVPATNLLVLAYLSKGQVDLAIDQLERLINAAPLETDTYLRLADIYTRLGRPEDTARVLTRLERVDPANERGLVAMTNLAMQRRDYEAALTYAERLRAAIPDRPEGHFLLGRVYQAAGRHPEAVAEFRAALAMRADLVEPLVALTLSRIALGEEAEMISELQGMIGSQPNHFVAHNLLGEMKNRAGDRDAAITAYKKAVALNPNWPVPRINIANARVAQGDQQAAIKVLREAQAQGVDGDAVALRLARLLEETGDYQAAIAAYSEIIERQPEALAVANNLAMLLAQYGKERNALDRALKLAQRFAESTNPFYRDTLGWVLLKRGDVAAALPHLEFGAEQRPENAEIQYHLGMAYKELGRRTDARIRLERAIAANQDFSGAAEAKKALGSL